LKIKQPVESMADTSDIKSQITAQGEKVRKLKADKAAIEEV